MATGQIELWIDGRTASQPSATYGSYEVGATIQGGRTNVLPYTVWMTKLDMVHAVTIPSPTTSEIVVGTPMIPGLELRLPANTVIRDHDGKIVTQLTVTPVPLDRPPFPLPAGVEVPVYFTVQPGGAYVYVSGTSGPRGARLIYPNGVHLPIGSVMDFWRYEPDGPGWRVYGQGHVTPDGQQVVPNPGVEVYEFTGAMVGGPGLAPGSGPPQGGKKDGDPVDLFTGLFVLQKTDLSLPDVLPIAVTRTYRQADTRSRSFGIGATHPYDMFLVGDTFPYTYTDLILADGSRVHYNRTSPGTGYQDAVYQHVLTPTDWYGSSIVWNGSGWTLTKKDGTVLSFRDGFNATRPQQAAVLSIQDRFGNQVTLARDADANLTQIRSPNGRWIQLTYDTSYRVRQLQDNTGRTVGYQYDASGRLWKVTDAEGGVTEYTYDATHRMIAIKDPLANVYLMNQYDSNDRVVRQILPDGSAYQYAYSINGQGQNLTEVTNPRGLVSRTTFNSSGYAVSEIEAVGTTIERTTTTTRQAGPNFVSSITDGLGRRTDYTYDDFGHLLTATRLAGTTDAVTTTFTFEPTFFQLATISDPLQHTWTWTYDAQARLTGLTDPLGHHTTIVLNSDSQESSVTDPLSHQWQFGYTDGDLTSITNPLNQSSTRFVDAAGRLIAATDPLGRTSRFTVNKLNQTTAATDPTGGQTSLFYDPNSNLLSFADPLNHTTSYTYDASDRMSGRTDPLQKSEVYQYDANSNLIQTIDRKGQVTRYQYDALDRVAQVTFADNSTITYTYDAADRVTQVTDSANGTITRQYDGLDRITQETTPEGMVTYTYDSDGRRATMTVAGQPQVIYGYDDAHRLTTISQGANSVVLTYDEADRRHTLTYPNGIVATYGYDSANQLTSVVYTVAETTLGDLTYTYDPAGNRTSIGGSFARTTLPAALSSATYDAANRISTWGGQTFTHDGNDNLGSDGLISYVWNSRNELLAVSGAKTASYAYDGLARRRSRTTGATTSFLYDGINVVQELIGGIPSTNLLIGLGVDETFLRTDGNGIAALLTDPLNSTLELADSSGALQTHYSFEPFGSSTASGATSVNDFQFTGRENDGIGLYYYRARYYAPVLQRFISEDPFGLAAGTNLFSYASNAPTMLVDPLGLLAENPACGSPKYKPGVPPAKPELDKLLRCIQGCLDRQLLISSTDEPVRVHPPGTPHRRGVAADVAPIPGMSKQVFQCAANCGAGFGLDEVLHPSPNSTAPHNHLQIPPGKNGGRGDLPKPNGPPDNKCKCKS